ncbi:HNH endonuclease [Paraburkholderia sediminicola]|uniref:HNH endonuclease n=1 Tax=Paraburkholderia sediminicola TaxID=458836 RepID=UPI0038BCA505
MTVKITYKEVLDTPCVIHMGRYDSNGYGQQVIEGRFVQAHRLAYAEHHGLTLADIDGVTIRHRCDNPPCRNPEHLIAGTHADNVADMMRRRRNNQLRGSHHHHARLTEQQAIEIRNRYGRGETQVSLAKAYGVSRPAINMLINGKRWRHI